MFVGIAFLFLALRGWVRVIRRTRLNLSDIFVSFSWIGFVADSIGHTLLHNLGLELSPSKQNTVAVNADPKKMVQVYKVIKPTLTLLKQRQVHIVLSGGDGRLFMDWRLCIRRRCGLPKHLFSFSTSNSSHSIRKDCEGAYTQLLRSPRYVTLSSST